MKRSLLVAASAVVLLAGRIEGQTWMAPRGNGTFSISAEYMNTYAHTTGTGAEVRNIDLVAKTVTVALDYSFTDKLAVGIDLPYVESRYRGPAPHPGALVDDGGYHGTVTDFSVVCRYQAWDTDAITFTPMASLLIPTHEYATMGHASPGRGLYEMGLGFDAGRELVELTPGLFVQGRFVYTLVERVSDFSVNRSNAGLMLSYVVHPRVVLTANGRWQKTHGGLDVPLRGQDAVDYFHNHDQLTRADFVRAGAGFSYTITQKIDLFANYEKVLSSENSHVANSYTLGLGYNFASRLRPEGR